MPRTDALAHLAAVAGYALMVWCAFGYSWRKRLESRGPWAARTWMRWHVVAGIGGPALVLWHTGWSFGALAGVTMALTVVVVASGAVGRWVYTSFPAATPPGAELERIDEEIATLTVPGPDSAGGGVATLAPGRVERAAAQAQLNTLRQLRVSHERRLATAAVTARWRQGLAWWWLLHVPLSMAVITLALVHALATLYYAPFWR